MVNVLELIRAEVRRTPVISDVGRILAIDAGEIRVGGLADTARVGDGLEAVRRDGGPVPAEIVSLGEKSVVALSEGRTDGLAIGDRAVFRGERRLAPHDGWMGRILDANGRPLDGRPLLSGPREVSLLSEPPDPARRRGFGPRIDTGFALFNTLLPLARGQRIGLFAGSGVGKSMLLAQLARQVDAEVVIIALVGERGREVREFVGRAVGDRGLARSVVFSATSDRPALERRRCLLSAMAAAEYFRDAGRHVLLLCDSLTRFAEAHREVALASGEASSLMGFPPSMPHQIMSLVERAGTGDSGGDITAIFTVLAAGSDMEGPVADLARGVLDGHVVLDRGIAERGRFPAVDILRSVSRALPAAATEEENRLITQARAMLGTYERSEMMIQAGLYSAGSDPDIDDAIRTWPGLDGFAARKGEKGIEESFGALRSCLSRQAPSTED